MKEPALYFIVRPRGNLYNADRYEALYSPTGCKIPIRDNTSKLWIKQIIDPSYDLFRTMLMTKTNLYCFVVLLTIALTACSPAQTTTHVPTTITATSAQIYSTAIESKDFTPTVTQAITSSPVLAVTPEPTQVPTLEAHTWTTDNHLVKYYGSGGDGCCQYPRSPEFVLYPDGQLFIRSQTERVSQILTKQVTRREVCAFLNTIDQLGFLDYDEETYSIDRYGEQIQYFSIEGTDTQHISTNAWRSNAVSLYGLRAYLEAEPSIFDLPKDSFFQSPTILPAIRNTFSLITGYMPSNMEIYQPEVLEVWIIGIENPGDNVKTWQLEDPSLEYLINNSQADERYSNRVGQNSRKIVLVGLKAKEVFELFSQSMQSQVFTDGKNAVKLAVLPVLPYSDGYETRPTPFSMSCTPSDGQVTWKP